MPAGSLQRMTRGYTELVLWLQWHMLRPQGSLRTVTRMRGPRR